MMRIEAMDPELLGLDELARRAHEGTLRVPGVIVARALEDIPQPRERFEAASRESLSRTLERSLAPLEPHVAVVDSIRAIAQPGACLVVAGQQPGFLCSPLYNIYKALHAVRLARALAQAWESPVVPLFWNHADDHDVAEVHHTYQLNENLDLQKVPLSGLASGKQPFSRIVLTEGGQKLGATRQLLAGLLARQPHASEALELFLPRDGETLARAFTRSMTGLCGHLGLVVLEPDWIRSELTRSLARAVALDLREPLEQGAQDLRDLGLAAPLDPATAAVVYRVDERGRHALRHGGEGFQYDDEEGSRTRSELAAEMVTRPGDWSPAALLRPVVQDLCLPVAAYVGGSGELAYHAQLAPLRKAVGAPPTPFVPRLSCTLVDPECERSLARLGLSVGDVLASKGEIERPAGAQTLPVAVALREAAERAAAELLAHRGELAQVDRGLAQNLKRTAEQMRGLVEKLCEKAERVQQNAAGTGARHVRRVRNTLLPRGLPQERVLGPLPFTARLGAGWIDELFEQVPALARSHLVVHIEAAAATTPSDED
jgi:bacillithiol synthase